MSKEDIKLTAGIFHYGVWIGCVDGSGVDHKGVSGMKDGIKKHIRKRKTIDWVINTLVTCMIVLTLAVFLGFCFTVYLLLHAGII